MQWTVKRIRRSAVALALSAVVLGGMAACGQDDPEPKVENRPTGTETSPAAVEETPEEFIRRWFEVSKKMQNTGDTSEYLELSEKCGPCREIAEDVSSFYEAGGWIKFQGNELGEISLYEQTEGRYLVPVQVRPTKFQTDGAAAPQNLPGGALKYIVSLEPEGQGWQVVGFHEMAA